MDSADASDIASISDVPIQTNQNTGSQPPGTAQQSGQSSPGRSPGLTGAAARASDKRRAADCTPAAGPTANRIAELKNAGPTPPAGAIPNAPSSSGTTGSSVPKPAQPPPPCPVALNPYQRFLNNSTPIPLTPRQKAYLAVHNFIDPGNIITILGTSGIAIASDSHTAYGPGWRGFGRNAGFSFVQDATGDFFGTFLIPSIAHEDPHYHRMPNASIPRRTLHAISRTVIAQSDYGHPMPNYATLLTYPITNEIANLYVPGIASNGRSTAERIVTGYATDPIDNIITEFLPDLAKRVHVRVIFVQQIINQVATGQPVTFP